MQLTRTSLAALALLCGTTAARADAIVTAPGPLNSALISIEIKNNGPQDITSAVFDLSGTEALAAGTQSLVIDTTPPQIFSTTAPAGGTITYGGNNPAATIFTVNFTSFNAGDDAAFSFDPDIPGDNAYGAIVNELRGTLVTVNFADGTSASGTLQPSGDDLVVVFAAVPEPATLALFGVGGLIVAGFASRRRRSV